jgi:tetratricopeptide (TPR) repeat protein
MKVQFRSILFALVLPAAACGGDRETPTVVSSPTDFLPKPVTPGDAVEAPEVVETPKVVEALQMPTKYDELVALGKELTAKGQFGDAKEMFLAAIKLEKKKAEPHIEMARMYIEMKEKGLAVASANKAIKLAPLSSQAWNTKGRAELAAHNYDKAIEAFTESVELNSDNVFAWNNLGYTELLLKRYEDAATHLIEATSRKDAAGYMFNNLGTALEHLDRLDEARLAYEAGGKLGSKEATASRKRLEGVKTIAIAKTDEVTGEVHEEVRGEEPKVKEFEMVDETSDIPEDIENAVQPTFEEPAVEETEVDLEGSAGGDGSGASEEIEGEAPAME